ncbi:MAG: hypothetical protein ACREDH_09765, partial [Methylocella sp.]
PPQGLSGRSSQGCDEPCLSLLQKRIASPVAAIRESFSYRARLPDGTPVQGGGCVFFFFVFATAGPVGKK